MKKHKSVISILLAIMMVLTFMPTLAFADSATGEFNANHVDQATKDGKVLVEATCYTAGIVEVGCVRDGGICAHKNVVSSSKLQHDWVEKRFDSAADYAVALLNNGVFTNPNDNPDEREANAQKRAAEWLAGPGANVCYGYAEVCSICGALKVTAPGNKNLYGLTVTEHNNTGVKDCAASFTCEICGKEGATNSTHNKTTSANLHKKANLTPEVQPGKFCDTIIQAQTPVGSRDVEAWEEVTYYTCPICKQVVDMSHTFRVANNAGGYASYVEESQLDHTLVETIVTEPTCTDPGEKANVCVDCGFAKGHKAVKKLGHDYSVVNSVPATIAAAAYSFNTCSRCGKIDTDSYKSTGKPLNIAYSLEVFWPKNCDVAGIVKVTRQVENAPELSRVDYLTYDRATAKYMWFGGEALTAGQIYKTDKEYFKGFNSELRDAEAVEIPDIKPTGHKWAKADKVAEASCLLPEQEAMKCTICGDIKHPTTKVGKALGHEVEEVVVDATCGAAGYTYKICTRCNQYLNQAGKTAAEVTANAKPFAEPQKYNETAPVVKLGEKCTYEWKVLEEATPFKKGTRAKVCTVCNHLEEATKESIAEKTIAAPKVKAGKKKATVTVKAVEGAVKYQIKVNGKVKKTVTSAKKVTIKKLKGGKKAKFQIVAFNAEGVKAASKVKSVKIKK